MSVLLLLSGLASALARLEVLTAPKIVIPNEVRNLFQSKIELFDPELTINKNGPEDQLRIFFRKIKKQRI